MSKKAREKPAEAGSASVSPYGSVLGYELVTSQPNRLIKYLAGVPYLVYRALTKRGGRGRWPVILLISGELFEYFAN